VAMMLVLAAGALTAQSETPAKPAFDVASIKQNKSGDAALTFAVQPGGRFVATNIPLKQFIRAAYTLQLYQIDAPSWVETDRFDVVGTTERDIAATAPWTPGGKFLLVQLMMQSLLADRFQMVAHTEQRQTQGYALVADSPARAANRLAPAQTPCESNCGARTGPGTLNWRGAPLPQLAEFLSQITGRLVIDATGLSGTYDIELQWAPESQQAPTDAPSIFTALQEQLGLRLEPRRMPTTMLVIDAIERPAEN
jgi:uncharacterized protein (TIGR03435 family)